MQVSAGYDAHRLDPLEHLNYQSATYYGLVSSLMSLADELCGKSLCPAHLHLLAIPVPPSAMPEVDPSESPQQEVVQTYL